MTMLNNLEALVNNMTGRRGLRQEWEGIDDDIRDEIIEDWQEIVRNASNSNDAVGKIIEDLQNRGGLDNAWDDIDEEIRSEIREEWVEILEG